MGGVEKVDLKRTDPYRARAGEFRVLDVPPTRYVAVDGHGDPNTASAYADALATLYPVAYAMKFAGKRAGRDYVVPPLEALWWADDLDVFTTARDKSRWSWTALLAGMMGPGAHRGLLALRKVKRLALVTPYTADVQQRIVANYAALGIEVVAEASNGRDAVAQAARFGRAGLVRAPLFLRDLGIGEVLQRMESADERAPRGGGRKHVDVRCPARVHDTGVCAPCDRGGGLRICR